MATVHRVYNFSAGPAVLPLPVLEEIQRDLISLPNVVNLAKKTPATHMLVGRHRDRPGVLAHVFDRLRSGAINVQETEYVIFEGAHAAVARINLDGKPTDGLLREIYSRNSDILDLHVVSIG